MRQFSGCERYLILTYSRVLKFAKNQEPYFASIKFRDFEKKVKLGFIKFRDIFLFFNMYLRPQNYNNITDGQNQTKNSET